MPAAKVSWRSGALLACFLAAMAYAVYAAITYSGAYAWLAEAQLVVFGAYDPGLTLIGLALLLSVPFGVIAPHVRFARPVAAITRDGDDRRRTTRIVLACAAVLLCIGVGEGGYLAWRIGRTPSVGLIDLAQGRQRLDGYDRLQVSGVARYGDGVIVEHTGRGTTSRDRYTPLTSPSWRAGTPIQVVLRDSLAIGADTPSGSAPIVQSGAALRRALPGIARVALERRGLTFDPELVVLDPNPESAYFLGATVSFFATVLAISLALTHRLASRRRRPVRARRRWRLLLGGQVLADLWFESYETPWITVRVDASAAFDRYRPFFTDPDRWAEDDASLDAMLLDVRQHGGFRLQPDGAPDTGDFTLSDVEQRRSNAPEFAVLRC